jgi:hypothetical protein
MNLLANQTLGTHMSLRGGVTGARVGGAMIEYKVSGEVFQAAASWRDFT